MKKISSLLILFSFLVFSLALVFYKPQAISAQQYSCANRNPSCPENQYPRCQTAVGVCNPPGCLVSMYLKNGGWVFDCAFPALTPTPPPTPTPFPQNRCPVCPKGSHYHYGYKQCCKDNEIPECKTSGPPIYIDCSTTGKSCVPGCGCGIKSCQSLPTPTPTPLPPSECSSTQIQTAIGCIDVKNPQAFVGSILKLAIGIGGGIAFLLIILGVFQILTSAGNPEKIQAGKELITSALAGLLLIIFSVFLLELIGVKILQIPGFSK